MANGDPETPCPKAKYPDGMHCRHWYDDEPCCWCGDD